MQNAIHTTAQLPTRANNNINTPNPFMPSPKKTPQNKLQKKRFPESAKTSHVGMHFQQKTLPQKPRKQVTMHTGRRAQATHTSQRDAFTAYLPSLHLSNHTHHKPYHTPIHNTVQHTPPSTIITILNRDTIPQLPSHPHPQRLHTSQNITSHATDNPNLHSNTTPIKTHFTP